MEKKQITRRKFLSTSAAAGVALAAPGLIQAQTRSTAPIKVGVNLPTSGVFAQVGQNAIVGMKMYMESIKGKAAGRPVELIIEDETVQVNVGVAKARKLLENDKVHALLGGVATPVIYATAPLVIKERTPYIITVGGGSEITRPAKRNKYTVRTSYNIWAQAYPFAKWVAQNKTKKAYIFCPDYAAGKEYAEAFRAGFTEAGGTITGESYAPLASPDFLPFVLKVAETKPEAVFGFWAASAAVRYLKAADQVGLNRTARLLLSGFACDYDSLPETGNASIGALSMHAWNLDLPNPENKAFVQSYTTQFKKPPSYLQLFGWDALRAVVAAAERVKGDVEDKEKFAAAFRGLTFASPRGRMSIDETTGDVVQDLYIRETVAGGRELPKMNVIATLPKAVDPFANKA
ncbi:ABC transporter substrate-binding protein [Lacisediminimonas sp.]|uniref:ABC transporter substrate-binding protein n=1 Tax=Lacisediminimonas sp. TaxID=3060582 RepID=UPI002717169A|nr:ABC transporter substrate-binding protein [Lacisediminimonas sp.]MDO8299479.1 ABC transporter substrate-binding protein [Lacisediminimonas sp.]MDO9217436.1 ABC transporter substrate-binding protein [Lacisediminimonas sp.]